MKKSSSREKLALLESYQEKAEVIYTILKTNLPEENLLTLTNSLLILLAQLSPPTYRPHFINYLSDNLDAELLNGISPIKKESANPPALPKDS